MLMFRAVEVAVIEQGLEAPQNMRAARRRVEHSEVPHDLAARHKTVACDRAEDFEVAIRDAEGRGIVGSRQPLQLRCQRLHVLVSIPWHGELMSAYPHR